MDPGCVDGILGGDDTDHKHDVYGDWFSGDGLYGTGDGRSNGGCQPDDQFGGNTHGGVCGFECNVECDGRIGQ